MTISEDLRVFFQPGLVGRASTAWHHLQSIAELKVHKHIVVFFLPFVILHYFLLERFYMICESIIQSNLLFIIYILVTKNERREGFPQSSQIYGKLCWQAAHKPSLQKQVLLFNFALLGASASRVQRRTGGFYFLLLFPSDWLLQFFDAPIGTSSMYTPRWYHQGIWSTATFSSSVHGPVRHVMCKKARSLPQVCLRRLRNSFLFSCA